METQERSTPMIVLSGGPCAGKTTALARIIAWCQDRGFTPLIVPEAATELISSGLVPSDPEFQDWVLKQIIHNEQLRLMAARSGRYHNPVIICDRGRMDGQAYVASSTDFLLVLAQNNLNLTTARDLYSGVIFLDSAAYGAEDFYTLANNTARRETLQEARELNDRTKAAWHATPHLVIIPNRINESFDQKMWHTTQALARILGIPEPIECERKFHVHRFDPHLLPKSTVAVDIVQTYLLQSRAGTVERVRARGQDNHWLYFHTTKEPAGKGSSIEHDRLISRLEYEALLVKRDPSLKPIFKRRHCFVYEHQYCELDVFAGHKTGLVLLEVELHSINDPVIVPSFLGDYTDVTEDANFSNYALSRAT